VRLGFAKSEVRFCKIEVRFCKSITKYLKLLQNNTNPSIFSQFQLNLLLVHFFSFSFSLSQKTRLPMRTKSFFEGKKWFSFMFLYHKVLKYAFGVRHDPISLSYIVAFYCGFTLVACGKLKQFFGASFWSELVDLGWFGGRLLEIEICASVSLGNCNVYSWICCMIINLHESHHSLLKFVIN